jgi:2-amino-4-hydroxy-6-hydroxymethyldihydropteridine diphosphokinase
MSKVILSLGSNIGDRSANLRHAVKIMSDRGVVRSAIVSDVFENPPMLPEDSLPEWNLDFFNIAVVAETDLSLSDFFDMTKQIEIECGRVIVSRWAPRIIDIDILFFDDVVIESESCIIPHKDALNRDFVMVPLVQIAADYKYPKEGEFFGKTIAEIFKKLYIEFSEIYK